MRLFPTLTWVGLTTFVGVSIAAKQSSWLLVDYWSVILVFCSGIMCHGLLAHSANDYVDWTTGTDYRSPGLFSGGSRVIPEGYLALDSMWNGMGIAAVLCIVLMILLYLRIGSQALIGGVLAAFGAIFYSLPPLMLSYRPVVAEWFAVVPSLVACGWLAYVSASDGQPLKPGGWLLILMTALVLVGHLMFHHLSDIEADLAATPRKLTTPALFSSLTWDPRYIPAIYFTLVVAMCLFTGMYLLGLACTLATALSMSVNLSTRKLLAELDKVLLLFLSLAVIIEVVY